MNLNKKMLTNGHSHLETSDKISIIGAGSVGMAAAVSILNTGVTKNLVLVDPFGENVKGEILDLQHGAIFINYPKITGGNTYDATKGSKLCIITAGSRQLPGESRLNMTQRNADIIVKLIPEIIKYSPETLILMVTNPCDVLSYVAWKSSGLPASRVIGAGTTVDSARFKWNLSQRFKINPADIQAWVIGEHGDNSIALWSTLNISGVRIQQLNPDVGFDNDPEDWIRCHKDVISAAHAIIELKGYTNWAIGMSIAIIAKAIMANQQRVFPVSVNAKGKYGIQDNVYIPLPAVVGYYGVSEILDLNLDEKELTALKNTARLMKDVQDGISLGTQSRRCNCTRCKRNAF